MDHSALHPLVLGLLNPERHAAASPGSSEAHRSQPASRDTTAPETTITISGAKYHVTSAEVDLVLAAQRDEDDDDDDEANGASENTNQAARLILTLQHPTSGPSSGRETRAAAPSVQVAAHVLVRRRTSTPEVEIILDSDALATQHDDPAGEGPPAVPGLQPQHAPQRASHVRPRPSPSQPSDALPSPSPTPAGEEQEQRHSLARTYRAYIAAINARSMAASLPRFCRPTVTHNGRALALAEYRRLMEDAQAAIPDISFGVSDLLVDEGRGLVGARLAFRGTPAGEFAGVRPPALQRKGEEGEGGGDGAVDREVAFSEIVFYWFEDGRITEVVSLVDVDAYRSQLTG